MSIEALVPEWPAPPAVRSLITTRQGGLSTGVFTSLNLGTHVGDDPQAVRANRARVRSLVPAEPLWLRQVHGTRVIHAEAGAQETEADAAVAHAAGPVVAVLTADCLPVLFCDTRGSAVGVAHAGWRGLAAGILENTVAALRVPPDSLMAYLGPAIGPAVYEVGPEVRETFVRQNPSAEEAFQPARPGRFLADLYLLARQRLTKAGIMSVHGGDGCTFTDNKRFFSYRRDGETGRMASLIWLRKL